MVCRLLGATLSWCRLMKKILAVLSLLLCFATTANAEIYYARNGAVVIGTHTWRQKFAKECQQVMNMGKYIPVAITNSEGVLVALFREL